MDSEITESDAKVVSYIGDLLEWLGPTWPGVSFAGRAMDGAPDIGDLDERGHLVLKEFVLMIGEDTGESCINSYIRELSDAIDDHLAADLRYVLAAELYGSSDDVRARALSSDVLELYDGDTDAADRRTKLVAALGKLTGQLVAGLEEELAKSNISGHIVATGYVAGMLKEARRRAPENSYSMMFED